jgi:hypothetical protein
MLRIISTFFYLFFLSFLSSKELACLTFSYPHKGYFSELTLLLFALNLLFLQERLLVRNCLVEEFLCDSNCVCDDMNERFLPIKPILHVREYHANLATY